RRWWQTCRHPSARRWTASSARSSAAPMRCWRVRRRWRGTIPTTSPDTQSRAQGHSMPIAYARFLVGRERTVAANRQVGLLLAFVAGAINAGGFLAVRQYTSHVTGLVSSMADNLVLGDGALVASALAAVLAFLLGAMCCAVLV